MVPKLDDLFLSVVTHRPHTICVVETWLGSEINSSEIDTSGYPLFRKDRNRRKAVVSSCTLQTLYQ